MVHLHHVLLCKWKFNYKFKYTRTFCVWNIYPAGNRLINICFHETELLLLYCQHPVSHLELFLHRVIVLLFLKAFICLSSFLQRFFIPWHLIFSQLFKVNEPTVFSHTMLLGLEFYYHPLCRKWRISGWESALFFLRGWSHLEHIAE